MTLLGKFSLLLFAIAVCAIAGFVSFRNEQQVAVEHPHGIYQVVAAQFVSVREADYIQAYDRTSRTFQVNFDLDEFASMTRTYIPSMARATRVEFGTFQRSGHSIRLRVYLIDRKGVATACLYTLVAEAGQWKIENIEVLSEWPKGSRLTGLRV